MHTKDSIANFWFYFFLPDRPTLYFENDCKHKNKLFLKKSSLFKSHIAQIPKLGIKSRILKIDIVCFNKLS